MAIKAGRVGVNRSDVDDLGHITSGGLTQEERAKLDKTLVTPITAPTEKEIVGVGTTNEQIMFKLGTGLAVDGNSSPFTLNASGLEEITGVTFASGVSDKGSKFYRLGNLIIGFVDVTCTSSQSPVICTFPDTILVNAGCDYAGGASDNGYNLGILKTAKLSNNKMRVDGAFSTAVTWVRGNLIVFI